jgi:hypothetical protein
VWLALYARWRYFPWNDYVRTAAAVSTGVNYASAVPQYEVYYSGNNQGERLLHYISPELTFGLPSTPDTDFVIRSHHRSGGGQYFGDNFPVYGSLFHGVKGGRPISHLRHPPAFLMSMDCPANLRLPTLAYSEFYA